MPTEFVYQCNFSNMKILLPIFLLVGAIVQFQIANSSDSQISRIEYLPKTLRPDLYDLKLTINDESENNGIPFHGHVLITIICDEKTSEIVLNVKDLEIIRSQVTVRSVTDNSVFGIQSQDYKLTSDQYVICLDRELEPKRIYRLFLPFRKISPIDLSDHGFIRYGYRRKAGQDIDVIKLTRSDINDARRLFPCFDEIHLKAKFNVNLEVPSGMVGIKSAALNQDLIQFENNNTPRSTYSLGIVVAKLVSKTMTRESTSITVWRDKEIPLDDVWDIVKRVLDVIEYYMLYMDMDAIKCPVDWFWNLLLLPNFREMNTEKLGMIILDESAALRLEIRDKDDVADMDLHLCKEISRQWIGAGATMTQWNEYWFQQALTLTLREQCFQSFHSDFLSSMPDILKSHLVETFIHVLKTDGQSVGSLVHVSEDDFDLTKAFADSTLTEKAYHIVRMMPFFLSDETFKKGVSMYYKEYQRKNSTLDQVWAVFNDVAKTNNAFWQDQTSLQIIMDSWIKKKGFPLINAVMDSQKKTITLTQEPFFQLEDDEYGSENSQQNHYWFIPLKFTSNVTDGPKAALPMIRWLTDTPLILTKDMKNEWLLGINDLYGLYRVNYDEHNWLLISEILMDENNYTEINPFARMRLVSDMFAVAAVQKLSYKIVFNTLRYLKHENSYFPLMVALQELNKIHSALFGTEVFKLYQLYVKDILKPILEIEEFVKIDEIQSNRQDNQLKRLVIETSCNFGMEKCIEHVQQIFINWPITVNKRIPEKFGDIVLCQAIKYDDTSNWDKLYEIYKESKDQEFSKIVLAALGCSTDLQTLQNFLSLFIDGKIPSKYNLQIISSLASNGIGYQVMKQFFVSRTDEIIHNFEHCKDVIGVFLTKLFEFTNTRKDFNELSGAMAYVRNYIKEVPKSLQENVRMAKRAFLWREKNLDGLLEAFQRP